MNRKSNLRDANSNPNLIATQSLSDPNRGTSTLQISKPLFALSFLFIRVFWWALVALPIIMTGKLPNGVAFALVFMTGLQWMWGYKVKTFNKQN